MSGQNRSEPPVTAAALDAFTRAVIAPDGPGSPGWRAADTVVQEFNDAVISNVRANGGKLTGELADVPIVLVTTRGARSGRERVVPLGGYVVDGGRLLIVASMGGAERNPPWYHNLRAHPDVTIEWRGRTHQARASVIEGDERDRLYQCVVDVMPVFAEYQARTSRTIPVLELTW